MSESVSEDENGMVGETKEPWSKMIDEVEDSLYDVFQEKVDELKKEGRSDENAKAEAYNDLLPAYRKKLREKYLNLLLFMRGLEIDKDHEKIMTTAEKAMREEDMDFVEAIHYAIDKRRFLIDSKFYKREVMNDSQDGDEEEEDEEEEGEEEEGEEGEEEEDNETNESDSDEPSDKVARLTE